MRVACCNQTVHCVHGLWLFSGVIAVSWYPPSTNDDNGEPLDNIVPLLLEVAHKYHIKVCMMYAKSRMLSMNFDYNKAEFNQN